MAKGLSIKLFRFILGRAFPNATTAPVPKFREKVLKKILREPFWRGHQRKI